VVEVKEPTSVLQQRILIRNTGIRFSPHLLPVPPGRQLRNRIATVSDPKLSDSSPESRLVVEEKEPTSVLQQRIRIPNAGIRFSRHLSPVPPGHQLRSRIATVSDPELSDSSPESGLVVREKEPTSGLQKTPPFKRRKKE
jgi:hypothetical protein